MALVYYADRRDTYQINHQKVFQRQYLCICCEQTAQGTYRPVRYQPTVMEYEDNFEIVSYLYPYSEVESWVPAGNGMF